MQGDSRWNDPQTPYRAMLDDVESTVMSRAFVKEQDAGAPEDLPERQVSEHVNFVTPAGLRQLREEAAALEEQRLALLAQGDDAMARERLSHIDRDLRYVEARLGSAQLVDPAAQPRDEVAFGAAVTVSQRGGERRVFTIVGEDEADAKNGRISYVTPLAQALTGARIGDVVVWKRPAGDRSLTVEAIDYPA
jgi:transcription elongation factor GreB